MTAAGDIYVGYRYERLVITGPFERMLSGEARFPAVCDCGREVIARFRGFFLGKSCGCLQRESAEQLGTTHGGYKDPLYRAWIGMKSRCYGINNTAYRNYGGRGITVCKSWREDYTKFRDWALTNGYASGLDLDRRNNNGPYSPSNCRWITRKQNARNKRTNRVLEAWGEKKCVAEWAEDSRCRVSAKTLDSRLRRGWSPERSIGEEMKVFSEQVTD